jgi:paraquat-inducible protein B
MSRIADEHPGAPANLAKPVVKKMRWPRLLAWLAPILAAIIGGFFLYDYLQLRGPEFTITFSDASGLKPGETKVMHLGVDIGQVSRIQLTPDQKQAVVTVRLQRSAEPFAKQGAIFWVVRPEISIQQISGLATVLSGPYIDTMPGTGEIQKEFTGLDSRPVSLDPGLRIILKSPRVDRITADSPVYFRGAAVGVIEKIDLDPDADTVNLHLMVEERFSPLVRANSKFWAISGVDVKGGLLTGMQMKVESIKTLLSGGVAFATPDKDMGDPAQDGDEFPLYEDPKPEWLDWAPKIPITPDGADHLAADLPHEGQNIRSAVGGN